MYIFKRHNIWLKLVFIPILQVLLLPGQMTSAAVTTISPSEVISFEIGNMEVNDIPGEPISNLEMREALNRTFPEIPTDEERLYLNPKLFEGDIVIKNEDQLTQILNGGDQLSAINNPNMRWSGGVIPYSISSYFSAYERQIIAQAMGQFHSHTCIRFTPRTSHRDYIFIVKGQGCFSLVGRNGGQQSVSLGSGCVHVGVVTHELMHAVGFWHEQSRSDRDSYVIINWGNIYSHLRYNFAKKSLSTTQHLGIPYDYNSVMHYGAYAFTIGYNRPTITPRKAGITLGQRRGLSEYDKKGINMLYQCKGTTPGPTGCVDKSEHCSDWALKGECTRNSAYMDVSCCKSCKKDCSDDNEFCQDWASKGECTKNPAFMTVSCKKSCKSC